MRKLLLWGAITLTASGCAQMPQKAPCSNAKFAANTVPCHSPQPVNVAKHAKTNMWVALR